MPLLDTPDIRQLGHYDCGRASAAVILRFHGMPDVDSIGVLGRLPIDRLDGTDPAQMAGWWRANGYSICEGRMDIDLLRHFADVGVPVQMVATIDGQGHWLVSRGIARGRVYVQDPFAGRGKYTTGEWLGKWYDYNRYGTHFNQWGIAVWNSSGRAA